MFKNTADKDTFGKNKTKQKKPNATATGVLSFLVRTFGVDV